jgi:hypothetical protein
MNDWSYDPAAADALWQFVIEIGAIVLVALLVSIREQTIPDYTTGRDHTQFVLKPNILTMLALRGGTALLVAQYLYGFEDSWAIAIGGWITTFYLLRKVLPLNLGKDAKADTDCRENEGASAHDPT